MIVYDNNTTQSRTVCYSKLDLGDERSCAAVRRDDMRESEDSHTGDRSCRNSNTQYLDGQKPGTVWGRGRVGVSADIPKVYRFLRRT